MNNTSNKNNSSNNLSKSVKECMEKLEKHFVDCPDIIKRQVYTADGTEGYFIYIEGLINQDLLQRDFIKPILNMNIEDLNNEVMVKSLSVSILEILHDFDSMVNDILLGKGVFLFENMNHAISCALTSFEKRSITEPDTEKNVRGAHEGFIESALVNISILRRRVRNNNLKFKTIKIGYTTNQTVFIAYIKDIANPKLLNELARRIKTINYDGVIGSGYIEQMIMDSKYSPFPQFVATERPDKTVSHLLEGKLAVIVDGTPVVIIAPVSFFSFFQAVDDYNSNYTFGSFLGILRAIALFLAVFLPGIYIAVTTFHYYLVPLRLLVPLAESRELVPFPPYFEALIMELTIEMLREASIRLPTYIGTSLGVIGGIIIGQAAVQAGIVSVLMIIVVAVTAIASYVSPVYEMGIALRFYRFIVMIASSIYGLVGILTCGIFLIVHLLSLESLGQPYLQPVVPFKAKDTKDIFLRVPFKYMRRRPDLAQPLDKERGKGKDE